MAKVFPEFPDVNHYLRTSSIDVDGNLNFRNSRVRGRYNKLLIGEAQRQSFGHEMRGNHSVSQSFYGNVFSRPPSWTRSEQTSNQAYVQQPFSSSIYELTNLNTYDSGSIALESTDVSASGSAFYSKYSNLNTVVYAITASIDLSGSSSGKIGEFVAASGNLFSGSDAGPMILEFDVPEYGRIVDINIWLEVISDNTKIEAAPAVFFDAGILSLFHVSLRSPNVSGFASYPWMNGFGHVNDIKSEPTLGPAWASQTTFDSFIIVDNSTFGGSRIPWNSEKSIRTKFTDSSRKRNYFHMDSMFASGSDPSATHGIDYVNRNNMPSYVFSSSILGVLFDPTVAPEFRAHYDGVSLHWITDPRVIQDVAIFNSCSVHPSSSASPPPGWLTGPGGTAAVNEFDTTGSNLGPATMRPLYPLLDEVVSQGDVNIDGIQGKITGKRPGLRGTEMHGVWTLQFVTTNTHDEGFRFEDINGNLPYWWFRQARLEITYEKNVQPNIRNPRLKIRTNSRGKTTSFSGSATHAFDFFGVKLPLGTAGGTLFKREEFWTEEYIPLNTTFGITADTGSSPDYAVFTRVTGTLSDRLTASLGFQHAFLNNEFGTPYIPISSGSGEEVSFDIFSDPSDNLRVIRDTLSPQALVTKALTLRSVLANKSVTKTSKDIAIEKLEEDDS
ncbi:MAG: hypothetical protein ACW99G_04130 [Candidatus Thorarchaeota archaeon]|jgi:hypothetical protein